MEKITEVKTEVKNVAEKIETLKQNFITNPANATKVNNEIGAICGGQIGNSLDAHDTYEKYNDKWWKDVSGI